MTRARADLLRLESSVGTLEALRQQIQHGTVNRRDVVTALSGIVGSQRGYISSLRSAFSEWLRSVPGLDSRKAALYITDLDWIIHNYATTEDRNGPRRFQNLMIIEEKSNGAVVRPEQQDTLQAIDQALRPLSRREEGKASVSRITALDGSSTKLSYYGLHYLTFTGRGPLDGKIQWDGKEITVDQLERLIRFDLHPFSLRDMDAKHRRHHHNKSADLPLFSGLE
jgi:hypothetical protein